VTGDQATSESPARGPLCPNCREPLRSNLCQEQVIPGRLELTLEHEIGQPGWAGLFTDAERDEAARRLARAMDAPGAMSGRYQISALRWRALRRSRRRTAP